MRESHALLFNIFTLAVGAFTFLISRLRPCFCSLKFYHTRPVMSAQSESRCSLVVSAPFARVSSKGERSSLKANVFCRSYYVRQEPTEAIQAAGHRRSADHIGNGHRKITFLLSEPSSVLSVQRDQSCIALLMLKCVLFWCRLYVWSFSVVARLHREVNGCERDSCSGRLKKIWRTDYGLREMEPEDCCRLCRLTCWNTCYSRGRTKINCPPTSKKIFAYNLARFRIDVRL